MINSKKILVKHPKCVKINMYDITKKSHEI